MPHIFIRVFDVICPQLHLLFAKKTQKNNNKKQTKKTKQSELQPETKMLNAGKAHKGPNKFGSYIIFLRTL